MTTANASPSQQLLLIDTIRDGIIVTKDKGLRVVLMCSTVNFALKSSDEQNAIIYQFQNLLNGLDFPIQFIIQSRRLNISPYLETLRVRQREEDNELLKIQIAEYIEFIRTFVEMTNVMSKNFYCVVPFTAPVLEQSGFLGDALSAIGLGQKKSADDSSGKLFEQHKNQLWQRVDSVVGGLQQIGVRSVPLNTEELIELFYGLYNPTEFEKTITPAQ